MSAPAKGDAAFRYVLDGGQPFWHYLGAPLQNTRQNELVRVDTFTSADRTGERRTTIGSGVWDLGADIRHDGQKESLNRFLTAGLRGAAVDYFPSVSNPSEVYPCYLQEHSGVVPDQASWMRHRYQCSVRLRRRDGGTFLGVVEPSLFYFAAGHALRDLSFSRTGVAKYTDELGLIQDAAEDLFRTTWIDGEPHLLLELARENLCLRSEDRGNAAWTKVRASISSDFYNAPDGSSNGDRLVEDSTASNTHYDRQAFTKAASALEYTYSVYARRGGRNHLYIEARGASTSHAASVVFDLLAGDIETAAAAVGSFSDVSARISSDPIVVDGIEWYRCELTFTTDADTNLEIFEALHDGSTITYTGNGSSGVGLFGGQLELGAFATSYFPTTSAADTRNVESFQQSGVLSPAEIADQGGATFYTRWRELGTAYADENARYWQYGQTTDRLILLSTAASGGLLRALMTVSGTDFTSSSAAGAISVGDDVEARVVVFLDGTDWKLQLHYSVNGGAEVSAAADTIGAQLPSAWDSDTKAFNSAVGGGAAGAVAIRHDRGFAGVKTMAEMRAA